MRSRQRCVRAGIVRIERDGPLERLDRGDRLGLAALAQALQSLQKGIVGRRIRGLAATGRVRQLQLQRRNDLRR